MEPFSRHHTDLEQMGRHLEVAAAVAGVPYNGKITKAVLDAYKDFYSGTPVTFVTSTKPRDRRGLSVRYVNLQIPHDPYEIAIEKGFINPTQHPAYDLIPEIRSRFSMLGYGVDMEVSYGLAKIWPFIDPQPVANVFDLAALPESIKNHADYFQKHHLNVFSLFALDFRHLSVNVYFMLNKPGQFDDGEIAAMIGNLDLPVPSDEVLDYCTRASTIYFTFPWDSPRVERVCFGLIAHDPSAVPTHLHPLLKTYTEQAPILTERRGFIFSMTFDRGGDFIKIENDYTGTMIPIMEIGAQSVPDVRQEMPAAVSLPGAGEGQKMEWEAGVYTLFEKLAAQVPETFRPMVKPLLQDTAEKKCLERNAAYVSEGDLITALLDITPPPFQAEAVQNAQALGVDVRRYSELKQIRDQYKSSWEKFGKAFHPGNIHFAMYLTDRCNQACRHCASGSGITRSELPVEQWFRIVDNLETSLCKKNRRGVYIWFGGEPTCRSDIRDIIGYCGEKGYFQAIITNGTLFDRDFARYCADNGMSHVFVSIDSADPQKSDGIRGAPGSLEYAEQAVKNAREFGLFVCCSTTVMKLNIDELDDIKALAESWGAVPYFRAVVKQKKAAENWDQIGLGRDDYKKLYDYKYTRAIEAIRQGKAGTLPIYAIYEMVPFMEQPANDGELTALEWGVGCQACRTMAGIDVNGDVFPCGYPSKLTLGNALTNSFEEIMNSRLFKDIRDRKRTGKCASCQHLALCGGGCRVHAECETGDFFSSFSYCGHEPLPPAT